MTCNLNPTLLAAYVDDELTDSQRYAIEALAARNPKIEEEIAALRRLHEIWQSCSIPEPSDETWAESLSVIEAGLAVPASLIETPSRARRLLRAFIRSRWTKAAAVLFILWVLNHHAPRDLGQSTEPFPVASHDDVDVIKVHGVDADRLIVGSPLRDPLNWAQLGDVVLVRVLADQDGMATPLPFQPDNPMMLVPVSLESPK